MQPIHLVLFDIYGNVAEWVLDCGLPSYGRAPTDGSAVVEGLVVKTIHIEEVLGIQVRSSPAQPTAMPRVVEIMIEV